MVCEVYGICICVLCDVSVVFDECVMSVWCVMCMCVCMVYNVCVYKVSVLSCGTVQES